MNIKYIEREDIDIVKWDSCITRSVNGIVYAYSWYLDIVAKNWAAIVCDDYSAVFPLIYNKKYNIKYIYQPYFTQQLGLFSVRQFDDSLVVKFLDAIPGYYKLININLNTYVNIDYQPAKINKRITYNLSLAGNYDILSSSYSKNTKRNLSKAVANGVKVVKGIGAGELIDLKKNNLVVPLGKKHFDILDKLVNRSIVNKSGELYGAYTADEKLCAGALFLYSNEMVIYLLASVSDEGRDARAMFALVDHFIKNNSGSHLVLDFEGSNVESVARFYAGFGANPCYYDRIVINRLPWFVNFFYNA